MDIESVARKLKPLMPDQIERWMKVRDTADPELKALIDKQIIQSAYAKLGDFREKILLSLPPPAKAAGTFHLGTLVYEKEKWPVGISSSELLQHLLIVGRSGSGKSNCAYGLLEQLSRKKIPWLFLDHKRSARHLLPQIKGQINAFTPGRQLLPFVFNPFIAPPGLEPEVYFSHVVDALAGAFTLGEGAKRIMQKALHACHAKKITAPTPVQLISEIEAIPADSRARGWKVSALRALESLLFANVITNAAVTQAQLMQTLLLGQTIVELDALDQSTKKFLVPLQA